jgi:hypothetical protein
MKRGDQTGRGSVFGNEQDESNLPEGLQVEGALPQELWRRLRDRLPPLGAPTPVIGDARRAEPRHLALRGHALDIHAQTPHSPGPPHAIRAVEGANGCAGHSGQHPHGLRPLPHLDGHGHRQRMPWATPPTGSTSSFPQTTCRRSSATRTTSTPRGRESLRAFGLQQALLGAAQLRGLPQALVQRGDQKNAELCVPVFRDIDKDVPYVGTHVWPSQAAVHAGMTHVVNAIPDNWPMALHLAEGSIHTVQTPSAYLGLQGAARHGPQARQLKPMPEGSIYYTGHYVDHELVSNIGPTARRRSAPCHGRRSPCATCSPLAAQARSRSSSRQSWSTSSPM